MKDQGRKVLIAAADTFRAAAGEQLGEWANRAGVDIIRGAEGSDPASIIYDAVNAAKARNVDVLICDTAGRLHNKKNLMEELKKINRVIDREFPGVYRENLVVLDAVPRPPHGKYPLPQSIPCAPGLSISPPACRQMWSFPLRSHL